MKKFFLKKEKEKKNQKINLSSWSVVLITHSEEETKRGSRFCDLSVDPTPPSAAKIDHLVG